MVLERILVLFPVTFWRLQLILLLNLSSLVFCVCVVALCDHQHKQGISRLYFLSTVLLLLTLICLDSVFCWVSFLCWWYDTNICVFFFSIEFDFITKTLLFFWSTDSVCVHSFFPSVILGIWILLWTFVGFGVGESYDHHHISSLSCPHGCLVSI